MTDDPRRALAPDEATVPADRQATLPRSDSETTGPDVEATEVASDAIDDEELVPVESTIGVGTVIGLGCVGGTVLVIAIVLLVLFVMWLVG